MLIKIPSEEEIFKYVVDLANKNRDAIGFIPSHRYKEYYYKRKILIEFENDEPCGFCLFSGKDEYLKIYQIVIEYDLRRLKHATNLVNKIFNKAIQLNKRVISLYCADDLEANLFWKALGFKLCCKRAGAKGRIHNHFIFFIDTKNVTSETIEKTHILSPVAETKKIIIPAHTPARQPEKLF
ncbi:MAG: GNAT family N-acetyltransferase [Candidatus Aenigmatarchaeota archaeon]